MFCRSQTAYGSWKPVPKDVDLVIAGTSCVDYSKMNTLRKTREEMGESGTTIDAMFNYAKTHLPKMVLLENICQAPWDDLKKEWDALGYYSEYVRVDTRRYYIPQTRNRVYMACANKAWLDAAGVNGGDALKYWVHLVSSFERPASSTAGTFLLDEYDPRLEIMLNGMSDTFSAIAKQRKELPWEVCKSVHAHERILRKVGPSRPISRSEPGRIVCSPPDYFCNLHFRSQVERTWESFDIKCLTAIVQGFDPLYKEYVFTASGIGQIKWKLTYFEGNIMT